MALSALITPLPTRLMELGYVGIAGAVPRKKSTAKERLQAALTTSVGKANAKRLIVLRLGLGRDSMTMLALLGQHQLMVEGKVIGPDEVDAVVFTDPGHEWDFTYALIPRVQKFCDLHGLRFIVQKKPPAEGPRGWLAWVRRQTRMRDEAKDAGKQKATFGEPYWRQDAPYSIEARAASGYYHPRAPLFEDYSSKDAWIAKDDSSCTVNHKIVPNRELVADLQVERFGLLPLVADTKRKLRYTQQAEAWAFLANAHKVKPHLMLIGYAADELSRLKEVRTEPWVPGFDTEAYPLMEMGITKAGEDDYLRALPGIDVEGKLVPGGFADVKKSGCRMCKEQDAAQFWMLRELDPAFFTRTAELERRVVARTGAWQAFFPRRFVALDARTGKESKLLAGYRADGRQIEMKADKKTGRLYAYVWIPLEATVDLWLSEYRKSHGGRDPLVDEVARKEYRGCGASSSEAL